MHIYAFTNGCPIYVYNVHMYMFQYAQHLCTDAWRWSLPRMGHTWTLCGGGGGSGGEAAYLFGGYSLSDGLLSDVWRFDVVTREWTQLPDVGGPRPEPRSVNDDNN